MKYKLIFVYLLLSCTIFGSTKYGETILPSNSFSALKKLNAVEYPKFYDDIEYISLNNSIKQSITYLKRLPKNRVIRFGNDQFSVSHMIKSLTYFSNFIEIVPTNKELKNFIETFFLIYESSSSNGILFTAYCEPLINGSKIKTLKYPIPIYSKPDDLVYKKISSGSTIIGRYNERGNFVKYYSREELDKLNILEKRAKPVAWVASKVDRLIIEIEGSGRILTDDGEIFKLSYQTKNGHPYRSIGKYLLKQGILPASKISMRSIKRFLEANPEIMQSILNINPSFVFFERNSRGTVGALAVELTPGRSIATDKKLFPPAALAFIKTKKPTLDEASNVIGWDELSRFVLNQDTGGAIKGSGRGDIFFGAGPYAEVAASSLKHPGEIYFLILNPKANLNNINSSFTSQR